MSAGARGVLWRWLALRHVRRQRLRTTLAVAAIALAVAAATGMAAMNRATEQSFRQTARLRAFGADLVVRGGRAGLEQELATEVAALEGVERAVPLVLGLWESPGPSGVGSVILVGAPLEAATELDLDPQVLARAVDPRLLLEGAVPVLLGQAFAQRHALEIGSSLPLRAPGGDAPGRIVGWLPENDFVQGFGGAVVATALPVAQSLTGAGRRVDRILVHASDAADLDRLRQDVRGLLAGRGDVADPLQEAVEFEAILGSLAVALRVLSLLSLLLAAFLVHGTLGMALTERRRELAVLRCLGMSAARMQRMLLVEAFVLGAIGACIGVACGVPLARGMTGLFRATVGATFDRLAEVEVRVGPTEVLVGLALGIGAALVASWLPARRAGRRPPLQGLHEERVRIVRLRTRLVPLGCGLLLVLGAAVLFAVDGLGLPRAGYVVVVLWGAGIATLAYPLLSILTRRAGGLFGRLFGPGGRLARDHFEQASAPTSLTLAAVTLGFGVVFATDTLVRSFEGMLDGWFGETIGEDLFVLGEDLLESSLQGSGFDASLRGELAAIEGVLHVHALRFQRLSYEGDRILLLVLDGGAPQESGRFRYVEGSPGDRRALAAGEGLFVSEGLAYRHGLERGASITLPTPGGERSFPVRAVVHDYTWPHGVVLMDDDLYERTWDDRLAQEFGITLDGSRPREAVRGDLERLLAGRYRAVVLSHEEVQGNVHRIFRRYWAMLLGQEGLALVVAFFGTLHTLWISVLLRRREFGLLRTIGAPGRMIRRTIALEGILLGATGGVWGVLFGTGAAVTVLRLFCLEEQGYRAPVQVSVIMAAALVVFAALTGLVAGLVPAREATRPTPLESLAGEIA